MRNVKKGIICYQIEQDGCLNGVFSNEIIDGHIYNETANKITDNFDELIGDYNCYYFNDGSSHSNVKLKIRLKEGKRKTYKVKWESENKTVYKGTGYILNEKQFVVQFKANH